ncbi:PREDICTED: RNA polymerase II degradation factor 1 [Bactrocera latifrons]|uniref:RNA polymerase II degradation factor 1 n=1 Tax=Bactrocera latifrons TaxID=174628 RepID=UPI0008DE49ED|nr:PREDICTED: RNA polymerase II degradation factor 1 [Bactrocera latifrons]
MKAVRGECAWRFYIVLVFLLVRHVSSSALNVSTIETYTPVKSSDDKYDFVDVAQQHGEPSESETGQTSRFFTSADVDEAFWLEHLGEDFKNAIHLQVGGEERCNGVFNMSENGAAYKVQDESINKPVLQNEVKAPKTDDKTTGEKSKKKAKADATKKVRKIRRKQKPEPKTDNVATTVEPTTNDTNTKKEQSDITTKEQYGGTGQCYNDVVDKNNYKEDLKKYKKFQHINIKYAPEYTQTTAKKKIQYKNDTSILDQTLEAMPVVVNLPESNKMIELETNDAPVVVKMPPVIYHREPINVTDSENYTDNRQTQSTQSQAEQTLVGEQTQSVNTQYTQHPYSAMTYEQQQHYQQFEQYSPNTNYAQTQQHTQYPLQIQDSHYPTQYQQTTQYDQQPQQQHSSSISYPAPNYYNQGVYPPDMGSIPTQEPNGPFAANNIMKSRYMYNKRSVPSYDEYSMQQTQPVSTHQEYRSRSDSRSNGELYQAGL